MNENEDEKENLKAKKIRRILLLKTDQDLKNNDKKANIMINSKTIQELNQAYNSYKILLSESSPIYSNYVQIIEKMFPDNSQKNKKEKATPKQKNVEQIIKSLNSSFESHSPAIDFIPNKIDLGKKKFSFIKKGSIKNQNSPKFFEEINKEEDAKIKSTKLEKKNLHKVIDKIVRIKLPMDTEDDDAITKSVIKLRRYCYKLIKKRKKCKKNSKSKPISSIRKGRKDKDKDKDKKCDKGIERPKYRKRRTNVAYNMLRRKSLFGIKDNIQEAVLKMEDTYEKSKEDLKMKTIEKEKEKQIEKNKSNLHERKAQKMNSFKDLKTIREIREKENEKLNIDRKRKLRRVQTLNLRNQPPYLNKLSQKKEIKKSDSVLKQVNQILKEPMISTKFARPSKFVIINNNINNANIILKKDVKKKNSLFGIKRLEFKRQKTIKEKEKEKNNVRGSLKRNAKHTVKLFSPEFKGFKMTSDS
jgi:hypothetical protein